MHEPYNPPARSFTGQTLDAARWVPIAYLGGTFLAGPSVTFQPTKSTSVSPYIHNSTDQKVSKGAFAQPPEVTSPNSNPFSCLVTPLSLVGVAGGRLQALQLVRTGPDDLKWMQIPVQRSGCSTRRCVRGSDFNAVQETQITIPMVVLGDFETHIYDSILPHMNLGYRPLM